MQRRHTSGQESLGKYPVSLTSNKGRSEPQRDKTLPYPLGCLLWKRPEAVLVRVWKETCAQAGLWETVEVAQKVKIHLPCGQNPTAGRYLERSEGGILMTYLYSVFISMFFIMNNTQKSSQGPPLERWEIRDQSTLGNPLCSNIDKPAMHHLQQSKADRQTLVPHNLAQVETLKADLTGEEATAVLAEDWGHRYRCAGLKWICSEVTVSTVCESTPLQ